MHRKQLIFLENWLKRQHRKPLIVRGARQVGKSTLVELFANQHELKLQNVNLERFPELSQVFATKDPKKIISQIEFLPDMPATEENSLLFLDEIQAVPPAIPALRYFFEDMPELPLVSAGSLLEFVLSEHQFSMPVGRVQYLHMGPMCFSEFLLAIGEDKLTDFILNYRYGNGITELVHNRLMELLRTYYFVGGMPEAVSVFADTRSYREVSAVHNSIIDTYREDFPKYAGTRNLNRLLAVFNFAARNVGVKVKYSNIAPQEQSSTLKQDIELLAMARVVSKIVHSHCSGLPLQASMQEKVFKLLFLDIGLMNAICGLNWRVLSQLDEMKLINEGVIAEQFVGQHLQSLLSDSPNRELTYWLREGRSANAEVDFVIGLNGVMLPIEIKAGATGSMKSLHQFMGEKKQEFAVRFDAALPEDFNVEAKITKNTTVHQVKYRLLSLPLYLVERLDEIVLEAL